MTDYEDVVDDVVRAIEGFGVVIMVVGGILAFLWSGRDLLRGHDDVYRRLRQHLGRVILLGLEVLIIADIVQTITIDPTLESALTLALIVFVRTFISFSLEIELDGVVPWRKQPTRIAPTGRAESPTP